MFDLFRGNPAPGLSSPMSRRAFTFSAGALAVSGMMRPGGLAAQGQQRLEVVPGGTQAIPIAIPNFAAGTPSDGEAGVNVAQVITNNLRRSGLFAPIDQADYIEKTINIDAAPQFQNWKTINAQALVTGRMTRQPDGRLKAEFRLWDVTTGQQITGQQYFTSPEYWRRIAHIRFSPARDEQLITYMEFGQGDPRVYLYRIETGEREIVGNFPGMSFSPRFSPDGQRVIMSLQQGGNSNLFVMDLRSKSTTRLTDTPAIDTSPSYAPDGTRLCFESDRGGKPQIYVMPATGGPAQRISFGEGSYSTPVWSPRGDYIAFTKQGGGQFSIGIMKTDGSGERILTSGFHNEGPTFAPNGRVLMFFRDPGGSGGPSLFTVDVSGRNEQRVPTPGFASDPAWSPLLS